MQSVVFSDESFAHPHPKNEDVDAPHARVGADDHLVSDGCSPQSAGALVLTASSTLTARPSVRARRCEAFVVQQPVPQVASAKAHPMMMAKRAPAKKAAPSAGFEAIGAVASLFGGGAAEPAKKPKFGAKKVNKGRTGPAAAEPGTPIGDLVGGFFSEKNWGVQAVTILNSGSGGTGAGVPTVALAGVALWVLLLFLLRFMIFYGFFGDAS